VRVNCVAPGGMETPLQEAFMSFPEGVDWKEFRKVMTPLGNSTPEEIAKVVAFVASDDCRYMTGSIVSIDGGLTV
jgi:NAD(P)-dependent dehydrogenase (short-subunit alcohol dehydrogenase family)